MGSGSSHDLNANKSAPSSGAASEERSSGGPEAPAVPPPTQGPDGEVVDIATVGKNLTNVIHDEICIEYFAIHLAHEHSSENLDFYESVDHFRHEWDSDATNASANIAKKIWQLYVCHSGPLAVNLPSKIRLACEKRVLENDITKDLFDTAAREIYNVMNRDSFSRFKLSTLWTDYCAHPDRHPDGVPPPAVKRLADCYTGRRNSETLMSHVGTQTIDQVLSNQQGLETYQDFVKVESPKVGTETLLVFVALQQFKKFIDSIGIPTAEDKGEVEEKVKLMLEKSKEAINLPEALKKELEEIEGKVPTADIKGLCTIFANAEKLTNETLLQDGVFDKFLNSALYIKYRMTVMKEESLNASLEKSDALMQKRKAGAAA